jgi:hypothetical protein
MLRGEREERNINIKWRVPLREIWELWTDSSVNYSTT